MGKRAKKLEPVHLYQLKRYADIKAVRVPGRPEEGLHRECTLSSISKISQDHWMIAK